MPVKQISHKIAHSTPDHSHFHEQSTPKLKTLTDAEWLSTHPTLHKSRIKAIYKHCQISRNNVMIWNKQVSFLQASNTSQSEPFSTGLKLQHLIIHDFNQINIPTGGW